jgi:hypothetical protein
MSRHNKVNKDHYVQRGRLTPDEAARELAKMRQVGSQHTWQPSKKNDRPLLESKDPADGTETTEDKDSEEQTSPDIESRPSARATKGIASANKVNKAVKSNAKASNSRAAKNASAVTSAKAKTAKSAKSAASSTGAKPKRKAVLARNVGGGGASPRSAAKARPRKS